MPYNQLTGERMSDDGAAYPQLDNVLTYQEPLIDMNFDGFPVDMNYQPSYQPFPDEMHFQQVR